MNTASPTTTGQDGTRRRHALVLLGVRLAKATTSRLCAVPARLPSRSIFGAYHTTPRRVSADKEQAENIPLVVQRSPIRVAKRHAQNSKPIAGTHRVVSTISYHYFSNLSMTESIRHN